ncbi:MAG TPA: hypothetical protein VFC19_42510 [Candidatus Limnocylindrales bacterium]|nr:hypothetical protein [Candidatus Limnocylindrales bacterium]
MNAVEHQAGARRNLMGAMLFRAWHHWHRFCAGVIAKGWRMKLENGMEVLRRRYADDGSSMTSDKPCG